MPNPITLKTIRNAQQLLNRYRTNWNDINDYWQRNGWHDQFQQEPSRTFRNGGRAQGRTAEHVICDEFIPDQVITEGTGTIATTFYEDGHVATRTYGPFEAELLREIEQLTDDYHEPPQPRKETTMELILPYPTIDPTVECSGIVLPASQTTVPDRVYLDVPNTVRHSQALEPLTLEHRDGPPVTPGQLTDRTVKVGPEWRSTSFTWLPVDSSNAHRIKDWDDEPEPTDRDLYLIAGRPCYWDETKDGWNNLFGGHVTSDKRIQTVTIAVRYIGPLHLHVEKGFPDLVDQDPSPVETLYETLDRLHPGVITWIKEHPVQSELLLTKIADNYSRLLGTQQYVDCLEFGYGGPHNELLGCLRRTERKHWLVGMARDMEYVPEKKQLRLYKDEKDFFRGRKTEMKVGKALRTFLPADDYSDETIKGLAANLVGLFTPPELVIGFEKHHFDESYEKGPSSCMTYSNSDYSVIGRGGLAEQGVRPTDAYINGNIGVAYLKTGDRVTARTLIVEDKKKFVRLYSADYATAKNNGRVLHDRLTELGYEEDHRALIGEELVEIRADSAIDELRNDGHLTVFVDGCNPDVHDATFLVLPFIDWENYVVAWNPETRKVRVTSEDIGGNSLREMNRYLRDLHDDYPDYTHFGRSFYRAGGALLFHYECADTPAAQRRDVEALVRGGDGTQLREEIINLIQERDDDHFSCDEYPFYDPVTGVEASITEGEADRALGRVNRGCSYLVERWNDDENLVPADQCGEDPDGDNFLTVDANDLDLVWDDDQEEWINESDAVMLHDGTTAHRNHAIYHEGTQEFYLHDDLPEDEEAA